jgi:hypothetical protein
MNSGSIHRFVLVIRYYHVDMVEFTSAGLTQLVTDYSTWAPAGAAWFAQQQCMEGLSRCQCILGSGDRHLSSCQYRWAVHTEAMPRPVLEALTHRWACSAQECLHEQHRQLLVEQSASACPACEVTGLHNADFLLCGLAESVLAVAMNRLG